MNNTPRDYSGEYNTFRQQQAGLGLILNAFTTGLNDKAITFNEKVNANIEAFNVNVAQRDADIAIQSANKAATQIRAETDTQVSNAVSQFAASNIVSTSGSALLTQLKLREVGETSAQNVILQGQQAAQNAVIQGQMAQYRQELNRARAQSQRQNNLLNGVASAASTAAILL